MFTVVVPMPYGCQNGRLSRLSEETMARALSFWEKSFQGARSELILALGAFRPDYEEEMVLKLNQEVGFLADNKKYALKILTLQPAEDEEDFATILLQALSDLRPLMTVIVICESLHAISLKPIFRKKFGRGLVEFRTLKAEFELKRFKRTLTVAWRHWLRLISWHKSS